MKSVKRALGQYFGAMPRRPTTNRGSPVQAKALAQRYGLELERLNGGVNVWPPRGLLDAQDPFSEDHFAQDWREAAVMCKAYAALLDASGASSSQAPGVASNSSAP